MTRKQRREQNEHQTALLGLVNVYLKAAEETKTELILQQKFNNLQNVWKSFVHRWNANPKRFTELRVVKFSDLVNSTLEKRKEDEKKNPKN